MGPLQNLHMFVGCFEISIRAIAINNKHVTRGLVAIFSAWGGRGGGGGGGGGGGQKNMLGCGLLGEDQYLPRLTL